MVGYVGITTPQVFDGMMYFGNTGTGQCRPKPQNFDCEQAARAASVRLFAQNDSPAVLSPPF
jgi:hypothetical protein